MRAELRGAPYMTFYCQEVYQSPNEALRVNEELWKPLKPTAPLEISACCAAHEEEWGLGYETDEEMVLQTPDSSGIFCKPRFLNKVPAEIETILEARSGTHEIAIQTEESGISPENWNYEALRIDASTIKKVSYVKQPEVSHRLEVKIEQAIERTRQPFTDFTCKFCRKPFKNGQALGGHLSRCHPA